MQLPEPHQQQAQIGQPAPSALQQAVDRAITEELIAGYRDTTPLPLVGTAPPVAQPGRTPMSQGATDASVLMLCGGGAAFLVSGGVSLVMWASESADPVVCGIVFGAPTVLALALGRLFGKVKAANAAAPAPVHHHYNGNVIQDQRSVESKTYGVIANTRNQTR
ncbi:hypothetical protein ABZS93_16125 [Streptomyces sp900116325]|uniref:hypothetical protein n=1 Tax=Streptomyces sp. 900116325 TaxID=3154295 RepID=UPI0033ABC390